MDIFNENTLTAIRVEMARRNINQSQLAESAGISRQYLSEMMRGRGGDVPDSWQRVLMALGWRVAILDSDNNEVI